MKINRRSAREVHNIFRGHEDTDANDRLLTHWKSIILQLCHPDGDRDCFGIYA